MRCFSIRFAPALAGVILLGCGEAAGPSAPADPPVPSFGAEHYTILNAIYLGGVPSNPLVVGAGFAAGITPQDVCDGNGGIPEGEAKGVLPPPGGDHQHTFARDVHIDVFAFGGGTDPCALAGAPIVATGTGKFTFNVQVNARGGAVLHATVQGIVDLVAGGQARLFGTARVRVLPDGTLKFDEETVRLKAI